MTTFSFLVRYDEEAAEGLDLECPSPTAAIQQARSFLADMVERHPGEIAEASVSVGEGSLLSDDPEWLGSWDWSERQGLRWEPTNIRPC